MLATIGRTLLAFLGLTSIASMSLAQGNTFNPYGNSGYSDYREFGIPMYSNNPALPGQSILNSQPFVSRPRANTFQDYANDLDGTQPDSAATRRSAASSLPYYQAYQRMNAEYDRVYKPNNTKGDRDFYERQKKREQDYANAIKETDPVKRAKLLRQVELDSLDRPAAAPRSAATKGATTAKPNAAGSTSSARSSAPVERRLQAPSPLSSDTTRRSGTAAGSASRAPAPTAGRSTAPPPPTTRPSTPTPRTRPAPAPDPASIPIPPPR
jgi:hypothetical protein